FDQAKELSLKISESAKDEDRFMFQVTNGESPLSNILNAANFNRSVNESEIEPAGNYISNRLGALLEAIQEAPYQVKNVFIITDGQQSQLQKLEELDMENISFSVIDVGEVEVQNTVVTAVTANTNMFGVNIPFT
ncbi:MAG TPA: hypothetical protein DD671_18640, partial [Balneolaceae bacterium]|nr:hypothetical protein [Balneolaceae bacterium]